MKTKYHISGYASIPVKIEMDVWAESEAEAAAEAQDRWNLETHLRSEWMVPGSEDHSSVWGFEPSVDSNN